MDNSPNNDGLERHVPCVHDGAVDDASQKDPVHTTKRSRRRPHTCVSRHHGVVDCADALCYLCICVRTT
ncbi:hypothetical protein TSMEX_001178 [Taenia solium]|eukprot:TsM_000085000 transcript=TsM_000085000 gene=TsM_000085000